MESTKELISIFFENTIFYYAATLMVCYVILAFLSITAVVKYKQRNSYTDFSGLLKSSYTPGISIIAPAYNEGKVIRSSVRSLLSLNYLEFEVIVVNDGSTDDSLAQLIADYDLRPVNFAYHQQLITQPIRNIYKSVNPIFSRLLVIDKEKGNSKADALNVGINAASHPLFLSTDIDCIWDKNTLLRMVKPFIEEKTRVIAVGAVLRTANSCEVENGFIKQAHAPNQFLPLFQELEYIRAFLLGRMAWSRINGLMLVSGALGMFDREIVLKAGGYDTSTLGEDFELVIRMRVYMNQHRRKHKVRYIPDALCFTEVPSTLGVFSRQRTRWSKGMAEALWIHKKVFFNPKHRVVGTVAFPYWVLFEWLAPLIEVGGISYIIYLIIVGQINWTSALLIFLFTYLFVVMISMVSILWDEIAGMKYHKTRDVFTLCLAAFAEPLVYHPLVLFFNLRGTWFFLTGQRLNWGVMTRSGFKKAKRNTIIDVNSK